jgi:hypothetical protein
MHQFTVCIKPISSQVRRTFYRVFIVGGQRHLIGTARFIITGGFRKLGPELFQGGTGKMRASYYHRIMLVLAALFAVGGFSAGALAANNGDSLLPIIVPEPPSAERLVTYNAFSEIAATNETAPQAAKEGANGTCCPTAVTCEPGCGQACCCNPHWIVGVEAVWLSPQFHTPIAEYAVINGGETYYTSSQVSGLFITPRIWLGYQGELWGIQGRYWRMHEPKNVFSAADELHLSSYTSNSTVKGETVDLEATRKIYWRDTTNVLSFGIRYAELDEQNELNVNQVVDTDLFMGSAYSRHAISGPGLTLALTGYKPLQNRNFNLFYNVRGSIVWEDSTLNTVETRSGVASDATAWDVHTATSVHSGSLFIGEIQVGAQWNFELVRNRADAFLRFALEYQYWDTNDTGLAGALSTATNGDGTGIAFAYTGDTRMDLIGFNVATGFTW